MGHDMPKSGSGRPDR